MIRLHDYWRSSASYRVRIALGLAGVEWGSISVNLVDGDQRSAEHLARNPQGLVPVLEIDGAQLTQSVAIIEYLDETHSLGLLPADPLARAHVRALAHAIAMEIHPVCNLRVAKYAATHSGGEITMDSWMRAFITPGLEAYERMLTQSGTYSYGDTVTLADLCLVPQMYNARRWGVDLSNMPKTVAITERLEALDAFAQAHPDQTPH